MVDFLIAWSVVSIGSKIYLTKKKVDLGINNYVIAISISLIIVIFLSIIQWVFHSVVNLFI